MQEERLWVVPVGWKGGSRGVKEIVWSGNKSCACMLKAGVDCKKRKYER
jgi:hypothetical protein